MSIQYSLILFATRSLYCTVLVHVVQIQMLIDGSVTRSLPSQPDMELSYEYAQAEVTRDMTIIKVIFLKSFAMLVML